MRKLLTILAILALSSAARAETLVGTIPLPVNWTGTMSGPNVAYTLSQGDIFIKWDDWIAAASGSRVRLCVSFTDHGVQNDNVTFGIITRIPGGTSRYVAMGSFGNTWSGSGLYHQRCTPKAPVVSFSDCSSGWDSSCYVHGFLGTNRSYSVTVRSAWLELFR